MRLLILFPVLLLAATTSAGPIPGDPFRDDSFVITNDIYNAKNVIYTALYDIVSLMVPLNKINVNGDGDVSVFFVEADTNANGEYEYKGMSFVKDGHVRKVLANGKTAAAFGDDSEIVYIGATDGIYIFNGADNSTVKYGTITDNVDQIEADNQTGIVYFLSDHQLFSVSEEGTKKNRVENVNDVVEFAIDHISNIFYHDTSKDIYVLNQNGVKKFEITPKPNEIKLVRHMSALEEGTIAVIDDSLYLLYPNGTLESSNITLQEKPTAYAPEATLLQYYAHDKNIYEYNMLTFLRDILLSKLKDFLDVELNEINALAI